MALPETQTQDIESQNNSKKMLIFRQAGFPRFCGNLARVHWMVTTTRSGGSVNSR
jgi:hypothetical protein